MSDCYCNHDKGEELFCHNCEEFKSLSEKISKQYEGTTQTEWEALSVKDVKEFIRLLKNDVILLMGSYNVTEHEEEMLNEVKELIDKLAGGDLI